RFRPLIVAAAVAAVVGGLGATVGLIGADVRPVVFGLALGGVALGICLVAIGRGSDHDLEHEPRAVGGPRLGRRATIAAGATVAVAVGVGSVPAARRLADATERLRSTRWSAGVPVVDAGGERVALASIVVGDLVNVYPQGWVGEPDSQAILLRDDPARFALTPSAGAQAAAGPLAAAGIVAYSKLCTHMACPLGLYEQQSGTLLCPCHQALFDVLAEGRVLRGPANRPLPMLPLDVDGDGLLIATGDFTDAVGTGFWGRP
ncbi:MAG TPA: Rieske (2Fe-2S) protein, partial [Ilumatobacteraceae bacterium]|nr:Rieske (2Fe-2S) protein [Ilumatobacteraceae bacterium]